MDFFYKLIILFLGKREFEVHERVRRCRISPPFFFLFLNKKRIEPFDRDTRFLIIFRGLTYVSFSFFVSRKEALNTVQMFDRVFYIFTYMRLCARMSLYSNKFGRYFASKKFFLQTRK